MPLKLLAAGLLSTFLIPATTLFPMSGDESAPVLAALSVRVLGGIESAQIANRETHPEQDVLTSSPLAISAWLAQEEGEDIELANGDAAQLIAQAKAEESAPNAERLSAAPGQGPVKAESVEQSPFPWLMTAGLFALIIAVAIRRMASQQM